MTWSLGHRRSLDSLRGVAVLLVVAAHTSWPGLIHGAGVVGVGIFFALSGYLITALLLDRGTDLRRFYARRIRRLAPALALLVLALLVLRVVTVEQALPALLYYGNFYDGSLGALAHTWSLAIEEQFYLLWPVILTIGLRRGLLQRPWLVAVIAALLILAGQPWYGTVLAGASVAIASRATGRDTRPPTWIAAFAALALGWAAFNEVDIAKGGSIATHQVIAFAAPFVVAWAAARPTLSVRQLELVGRISYGVYLYHLPLALGIRLLDLPWIPAFALLLAGSLALALASWFLVERPILTGAPPLKFRRSPTGISSTMRQPASPGS